MFGQAFVGTLPGQSAIIAFLVAFPWSEEAISGRRVQAVWGTGMHDQGMGIDWSIGDAILPMRSAIQAADQCSSLHCDEDTPGNMQVGRDAEHMTGCRLWRETPG